MLQEQANHQMNICQTCNKEYKRAQDLKTHITKTHSANKSMEIVEAKPVVQIIETSQQETADSDFDDEIDFDLSEDASDLYVTYQKKPRTISVCQTIPMGKDVGTQYEEHEVIVPKYVRPSLKVNGILQVTQKLTLNELPQICDDIKIFNGRLQLLKDNQTFDITNLEIFRQYESEPIDKNNRVQIMKEYPYKLVSYKSYKPDSNEQATYLNMRKDNIGNQFPALIAKLYNENPEFKCEYKEPQMAYFDIETYDTECADVCPVASRQTSHISMISLIVDKTATLFHLDKYYLNIEQVTDKIKQHSGLELEIKTEIAENENSMVIQFILALQQLSLTNTIVLAGFNSSQDGRGTKVLGYDWSFLLSRLRSDIKKEVRRCNGTGEFPSQLIQIDLLPNVYFVDMMLLFDEDTSAVKKYIEGRSLNSYLKYYKQPLKMAGNHKAERQVQIQGGDISVYGAYCLYDSTCLQLVQDARNIINGRLSFAEMYGLPLSMCLYQTDGNMLSCKFLQDFYKAGYMCTYSKLVGEQSTGYDGAHTGTCPEKLQYKSLKDAHIFDFASQYPNAGIQNNISPETYTEIPSQGSKSVQMNYKVGQNIDEDQRVFAHFRTEKQGIVAKFWQSTFDKRKETKQEQDKCVKYSEAWAVLEVKQLALKRQINSVYGLLGCNSSQFYKYECCSSVTGFARYCLNFAIQSAKQIFEIPEILFADTDSLAIQYSGTDVKDRFQKLNKSIADVYPRMNLEFEKSYKNIMYPKSAKSYANIKGDSVEIKGVPFNCYTIEYRTEIMQFFKDMLLADELNSDKPQEEKQEICYKYMEQKRNEIFEIIETKNVDALKKYVKIVKLGKSKNSNGKQTLSGYLEQTYPHIENYNTIPFNCHENKTMCVMPMELITAENINKVRVLDLVKFLGQPLANFFKIKCEKSEKYLGESVASGSVAVRVQSKYKNEKKQMPIEDLQAEINKNGNYMSFHEVMTNDVNKLYFDIEHDTHKMSIWKLIEHIQSVIQNQDARVCVADGCKKSKISYHVVVEILTNKQVNKQIAILLNNKIGKYPNNDGKMVGVVDLGVYSANHTMRLPNCVKIEDGQIEDRKFKMQQGTTLMDFLVSDTRKSMPKLIDFVSFGDKLAVSDARQFQSEANVQSVQELLKDNNIVGKIERKRQILIKKKPYNCPACGNKQTSDNLRISADKVYCYDDGCKGIQVESKKLMKLLPKPLKQSIKQNNRLVKYSLNQGHHTYVKSEMGTGKTEQLLKLMDKYKTILVISFRRTFADEFSTKMGMQNYQQIQQNQINMSEYPRLCVQLESLYRVNFDVDIDLVVFDEIESIQSQFNSFEKKQNNVNTAKVIELFRFKCLFMDALLQNSTIEMIQAVSGIDNVQIYENSYQSQTNRKMIIDEDPSDKKILKQIQTDLSNGKKVSVNCASVKLAEKIFQLGESMGLICAKYTGDNNDISEQFGVTQTMGNHKDQQLKDPNNHWTQLDLLVYTGTISAGISFTKKHFDLHVGILKNKTSDVISFIQGNHRVRDLADNLQIIYIFQLHHKEFQDTPNRVINKQMSFNSRSVYVQNNQIQQLNTYLEARYNCLRLNSKNLFIMWSEQSGYRIEKISGEEPKDFVAPVVQQQVSKQQFVFTEEDFKLLPRQLQQNDFSLTHCDEHMNVKIEIVRIAGIYSKNYIEIMNIYDRRAEENSDWEMMVKLQDQRIQRNLVKTALIRTTAEQFTEEQFPQIKTELLDYLHHTRQLQSQLTTNLNIVSDHIKTKYVENIIQGLGQYEKVKNLSSEQIAEYLPTLAKQQGSAMTIANTKLQNIGYKIESKCTKTDVKIDGKRTTQRTYDFKLSTIQVADNQKFLDW